MEQTEGQVEVRTRQGAVEGLGLFDPGQELTPNREAHIVLKELALALC